MKDLKDYLLNEDSLDDFDIDGRIAKKRKAVPETKKKRIENKISEHLNKLYEYCDEFLKSKGLELKQSKSHNSDSYMIYYPDLKWGFTYAPENWVRFEICLGGYGHIKGVEKQDTKAFIKELSEDLISKLKKYTYDGIRSTSVSQIENGAWVLTIKIQVKDLK